MQKLRSHISKVLVISLLWVGFGLYLAQPVEAKGSSKVFANWVDGLIKEEVNSSIQNKLDELSRSGADVHQLMEYTSVLLSQNDQAKELSITPDASSVQIYRLLLVEWNHFQTEKGMAAIPPSKTLKPIANLQIDKFGKIVPAFWTGNQKAACGWLFNIDMVPSLFRDHSLDPMAENIAIGAP